MRKKPVKSRAIEPNIFQVAEGNRVADFIDRLTPLVREFCRFGLAISREFAKADGLSVSGFSLPDGRRNGSR